LASVVAYSVVAKGLSPVLSLLLLSMASSPPVWISSPPQSSSVERIVKHVGISSGQSSGGVPTAISPLKHLGFVRQFVSAFM